LKKKSFVSLYIFIFVYGLFHVPFIIAGFGEPDAWRNGSVALNWGVGKGYLPARFPGFPVVELSYGVLACIFPAEKLWLYTNSLTLLLSLIGIYVFYKILIYHNISNPITISLLLFFTPILFVNASSSMDYLWTICFVLLCYWFLLNQKPIWGGIFLGLAIGCRLTTGIFIFPFILFIICNPIIESPKVFIRNSVKFIGSAGLISVFCYMPLFIKYQTDFLTTLYPPRDFLRSGYYILQYLFGVPGSFALIFFLIKWWRQKLDWNWELSFWSFTLFCYLCLFLIKPEKVEYLAPMMPFLLLLIGRIMGKKCLYWLTFLVIINNIVSFGIIKSEEQELRWIDRGIAWQKLNAYKNYSIDARFLINYPYPPDSTIVAGWHLPGIEYIMDTPSFYSRKKYLKDNRIKFFYEQENFFKNNVYYVFGSFKEKQNSPVDYNRIIYPPSSQKKE